VGRTTGKRRCGTVLRVFGRSFDARSFVARHGIDANHVWGRGESPAPELPPLDHGGFMVRVSESAEAHEQVDDVADFVRRFAALLTAVRKARSVEGRWLEFTYRTESRGRSTTLRVPRMLIESMADFRLELVATAAPRGSE
jgi:hypothetical protein